MGYYNTRTTFAGKQRKNSYLPNDDTFYPKRQRDQYPERTNKGYVSSYAFTMRNIIDSMISDKLAASGRIIKFFFEEYQKGIKSPDDYTRFYNNYVVGNEGHAPISNDTIYTLIINDWGEIIPTRVMRSSERIVDFQKQTTVSDNDVETNDPNVERKARELALSLVSDEEWIDEIYDGCHDWSAPKHKKALKEAYNSITRG